MDNLHAHRLAQANEISFEDAMKMTAPDWEDEDVPDGVDPKTAPILINGMLVKHDDNPDPEGVFDVPFIADFLIDRP